MVRGFFWLHICSIKIKRDMSAGVVHLVHTYANCLWILVPFSLYAFGIRSTVTSIHLLLVTPSPSVRMSWIEAPLSLALPLRRKLPAAHHSECGRCMEPSLLPSLPPFEECPLPVPQSVPFPLFHRCSLHSSAVIQCRQESQQTLICHHVPLKPESDMNTNAPSN